MKQKQVIDVRPSKEMTIAQSNEHLRIATNGAFKNVRSNNFDPSREFLNFEVQDGKIVPVDKKHSLKKRIEESLTKRGIINPNAGLKEPRYRTHADFILGGSREQMRRLAFGEQEVDYSKYDLNNPELKEGNRQLTRCKDIEDWAIDTYNFMAKKYGKENIAAFVVHLDEINPHVHCTVLPVTKQNKLSWKKVMVGEEDTKENYRRNMIQLHNEFSEINKKYDLQRGDPISETGAKHRTTQQFLEQQVKNLSIDVNSKKEIKKNLEKDIIHAKARLKGLTTMIANLENAKNILEEELEELKKDVELGKISIEDFNNKKQKILDEIEGVNLKIKDKEEKLSVAKKQLDEIDKKNRKQEEYFEELTSKIGQVEPEKVMKEMQSLGWNMAIFDARERQKRYEDYRETLSEYDRQVLDRAYSDIYGDSLISELAENGLEITAIATDMYLKSESAALRAKGGPGGGSSSNTGWGKKDDEDEWTFRKRCMQTGLQKVKAGKKKQVKR